ncbi:hypothetical protein LZ554_001586 [Drepanopeziza brunnea f. sp. 'monogermtubi']|nr:hypothetical protein LZ554_001586 [Drepanopeziza brunnea f. sp. 'monogermtubi']
MADRRRGGLGHARSGIDAPPVRAIIEAAPADVNNEDKMWTSWDEDSPLLELSKMLRSQPAFPTGQGPSYASVLSVEGGTINRHIASVQPNPRVTGGLQAPSMDPNLFHGPEEARRLMLDTAQNQAIRQNWLASDVVEIEDGSWTPVKLLGRGAHGVVSLWSNSKRKLRALPWQVVVKQSPARNLALFRESTYLQKCNQTGSTHFPSLIKAFHQATDLGSEVSRIYMEFCESGDLQRLMFDLERAPNSMDERLVWRVWECLARALCVLAYGSEDGSTTGDWEELAHLDIKPANILIGGYDAGHQATQILKLADLGLAEVIPGIQFEDFMNKTIGLRGTPAYYPPEQVYRFETPNRRFGSCSNVYQVGKCMYEIMNHGVVSQMNQYSSTAVTGCAITFGVEPARLVNYSNEIKEVLRRSLLTDCKERLSALELLTVCQRACQMLDERAAAAAWPAAVPNESFYGQGYPEPGR